MLAREVAEKRLRAFQIKGWQKDRIAALGTLPAALCETGRALFSRNAAGKVIHWEKQHEAQQRAAQALVKMSARDRGRIFGILFPKLAGTMEAAWQLIAGLPYEVDYDRKAFRAPSDPAAHTQARFQWLESLISDLGGYDPDVAWVAAWAGYLAGGYGGDSLGILLAAGLAEGGARGEEVFQILKESATNEHEIGMMGRHVTRALLAASRPDGWEFVEKLLLAAQRQEGLRQVILESIDEAHPTAFRRMLRLILEHNLLRFSATVRAVDVWFGLQWDSLSAGVLKKTLEQVQGYLEDPTVRQEALAKETGEPLYLALWATAFEDAGAAIAPAAAILKDDDVERRFVAVRFLDQIGLPAARRALLPCIEDPDLRIALTAFLPTERGEGAPDLWDATIRLLDRMPPRRTELPALVWPWATTDADPEDVVGALIDFLGKRPATDLVPYMDRMAGHVKVHVLERLVKLKNWDAATRDALFKLVGDRDSWVRREALDALKKCEVTEADALRVEGLLTRSGSELRQGVLGLLKKQKTPQALASADRLLASKKAPQRLAGLELLQQLVEKKRGADACRERARNYQEHHPQPTEDAQLLLEAILDIQRVVPTRDDGLGLIDPLIRSKPVPPRAHKVALCTTATMACLQSLDQLITDNRRTTVILKQDESEEETLLGNMNEWDFPDPNSRRSVEQEIGRLPLYELWKGWLDNRPKGQRDRDGLELVRACVWVTIQPDDWRRLQKHFGKKWSNWLQLLAAGQTPIKLKNGELVKCILEWLVKLQSVEGAADFLLDAVETGFAMVPDEERSRVVDITNWTKRQHDWRASSPLEMWSEVIEFHQGLLPAAWTEGHRLRLWQLLHWRDEPVPGVARFRPDLPYLVAGFKAGQASEADVLDQLIGPQLNHFGDLHHLTMPGAKDVAECPALTPIIDRVRARILEIELKRGELPTAATEPAGAILSLDGTATLFRLLAALGSKPLARNPDGEGRREVLTHLIQVTRPGKEDTAEAFAEQVKAAKVDSERLLQLGFLAPAWLDFIEHALGWSGLKEGAWWFLAHTPSGRPGVGSVVNDEMDWELDDEDDDEENAPAEPQTPWERVLNERTPLARHERYQGAVDTAWFARTFEPLGRKRWDALAEAARYGCSDNSFKKATLLAEVLQGRAKKFELITNIRVRRLKESVRLLGLFPLAGGDKREADLLQRYQVLVEYRRYARSLSPLSREDAVQTAQVGMENLARTAGYPDPLRLEWAMEAAQLADLAAGPVSATHEGVTVTLAIDADAQPEVTVRRGEKELKAIPAAIRKHPKFAALVERRAELKRSASRVKQSLESAMCRGDEFSGRELKQLFSHPLLRPCLERLVLVGEGIAGFPTAKGQALEDHAGKLEPVKADEKLRIAHCHDLYSLGDWEKWQGNCFQRERVQPFKQVFRELYIVTQQEKSDGVISHRYAGQQVNPLQAMALWGTRGWATREEVVKTFHDAGIVVNVTFRHHGWTAAEVEGLTLEGIEFRRRGEFKPMPLAEVPPRLFSEVMRDCDLVVSVAHRGGVDPEASASTVEMRAALLRETCSLLGISNCKIQKQHVLIDGTLGKYSVHLGSAVVHRQPGGSLCIVPVHAQHRGRLFLPFADDDPRTAEVISKVLLLARDHEIQDPSILEQLR